MSNTTQAAPKTETEYAAKVAQLNAKYPSLKAEIKMGWGGKLGIEVATVDKAKACNEMFRGFCFTSGGYR